MMDRDSMYHSTKPHLRENGSLFWRLVTYKIVHC